MADTFRLVRSTVINAPSKTVHALINDYHQWAKWSAWETMDPPGTMQKTYSGPASGVGSKYAWIGPKTGTGSMEITSSEAERIAMNLDFLKPFEAHNKTDFVLSPDNGGTKVVWTMTGPHTLLSRIMHFFFSMEKMVGPQFEQGLAQMKSAAESASPAPAAATLKATAAPKAAAPKPAPAPKSAKPAVKPAPAKAAKTPKAPAPKAKAVVVAKAAPARTAAPKAKPIAKAKAPVVKAAAKPASAKKPAAKAKPAAKPKPSTGKS